jgi:hypothetical protein
MSALNLNGTASTVVMYPPSGGTPHAYIFNQGPNNAHLGGGPGVSTTTGMRLAAANRMDLSNTPGTIYGIAGGNAVSPAGTITANTSYGGSVLTGTPGFAAGTIFTSGMTLVIDPGTSKQEFGYVFSANSGTVTLAAAMTYVHGSLATISQWSPYTTTLQVLPGAS